MLTNSKEIILIVAAHPDDEILGCGGTVSRLINEGHDAYTLILGEGVTSRDDKRDPDSRKNELTSLQSQIIKANKAIGVKEVFIEKFPDNRFDSVDLIDIIKCISDLKEKLNPSIIFTHSRTDLNIDHQITNQAVLTATRPMQEESVKTIFAFEILSSTEWNYPLSFTPDTYFDINETLQNKLEAISSYKSELRDFPHPRSLEGIKLNASYWGMRVGKQYIEAFQTLRAIL